MNNASDVIGQSGAPPVWVSGTSYKVGKVVLSPVDFCFYVRKVAGAGTTDPSSDATNWQNTNGIKSIQRGRFGFTGFTATATISAVVTSKSELRMLGFSTPGIDNNHSIDLTLTDSTTITATKNSPGTMVTVSWELTERF